MFKPPVRRAAESLWGLDCQYNKDNGFEQLVELTTSALYILVGYFLILSLGAFLYAGSSCFVSNIAPKAEVLYIFVSSSIPPQTGRLIFQLPGTKGTCSHEAHMRWPRCDEAQHY
jgi:hypothetical protein